MVLRVVIDTNVARSAGDQAAKNPDSIRCRDFLDTFRNKTDHRLVVSPEIQKEWTCHQSKFATRWLTQMKKSGRLVQVTGTAYASLPQHIVQSSLTEVEREALQKDQHLIRGAIETDRRIVSCEQRARQLFQRLAAEFREIQGAERLHDVLWISPIRLEEDALGWLIRGCPLEPALLLGAD